MAEKVNDVRPASGPFWFFDREARELVSFSGRSICLLHCDNSANILAYFLGLNLDDEPMPMGAYEDCVRAFTEIFGLRVMEKLWTSGEGTVVDVCEELDLTEGHLDDYLATVVVPESRLR